MIRCGCIHDSRISRHWSFKRSKRRRECGSTSPEISSVALVRALSRTLIANDDPKPWIKSQGFWEVDGSINNQRGLVLAKIKSATSGRTEFTR